MSESRDSKAHEMGMQIPFCVHSEVPEEEVVRELRRDLGPVLRELASQRDSKIDEDLLKR